MRKNKLIELLSKIDGNPEIKFWNGMVGDWMEIDELIQPVDLVKISLPFLKTLILRERVVGSQKIDEGLSQDDHELIKQSHKIHHSWDINEYVTQDDIKDGRYFKRRVFIMQAKLRGKKDTARIGDMCY